MQAEGSEVDRSEGVSSEQIISTTLPRSLDKLPDLLAFDRVWKSDKWAASQVLLDVKELEEMKAMIYGQISAVLLQNAQLTVRLTGLQGRKRYLRYLHRIANI